TTVERDEPQSIRDATRHLLIEIVARNSIGPDELVSVLFSVTADLASEYPARAARDLGWSDVSLLCMSEIPVPGGLPRCIRVLIHAEFAEPRSRVEHVYLGAARLLRPDWSEGGREGRPRTPNADRSGLPVGGPASPKT
ncbi:MAG: chorismate mutase, partial [Gemmatimonadota bacterium]